METLELALTLRKRVSTFHRYLKGANFLLSRKLYSWYVRRLAWQDKRDACPTGREALFFGLLWRKDFSHNVLPS